MRIKISMTALMLVAALAWTACGDSEGSKDSGSVDGGSKEGGVDSGSKDGGGTDGIADTKATQYFQEIATAGDVVCTCRSDPAGSICKQTPVECFSTKADCMDKYSLAFDDAVYRCVNDALALDPAGSQAGLDCLIAAAKKSTTCVKGAGCVLNNLITCGTTFENEKKKCTLPKAVDDAFDKCRWD